MAFQIPEYHHPDFSQEQFLKAPDARWEVVEMEGVAPEYPGEMGFGGRKPHGFQRSDLSGWTSGSG